MPVIGYLLSAVDNDRHMFQGDAQPSRCKACGTVLDLGWIDPSFSLRSDRTPDASYTYDGRLIVSDVFQAAVKRFPGADFRALPSQPGWSMFVPTGRTLRFDTERRRTRHTEFCNGCRRFTEVAGAIPVFLVDPPVPLPDEFMRTDIEFGSGDELHPLVLVGNTVAAAMRRAKLKGLELEPVDNNDG